MNEADFISVCREAIWVMIKVGAPMMLVGLVVGLAISLVQALTQIQESTLSFVPKIISMFLAMILFLPLMLASLSSFTQEIFNRIVSIQ
jgi:flagellar biosynthetic protein FliQ